MVFLGEGGALEGAGGGGGSAPPTNPCKTVTYPHLNGFTFHTSGVALLHKVVRLIKHVNHELD